MCWFELFDTHCFTRHFGAYQMPLFELDILSLIPVMGPGKGPSTIFFWLSSLYVCSGTFTDWMLHYVFYYVVLSIIFVALYNTYIHVRSYTIQFLQNMCIVQMYSIGMAGYHSNTKSGRRATDHFVFSVHPPIFP